jgi:hypothetical protein
MWGGLGYIPFGVQPLAGSPAITPSPLRGSGVIYTLGYLYLQYVICCGDVGVVYFVQLRTPEQSSVYSYAASIAMYRASRRGARLINVDDADTVFLGNLCYTSQQVSVCPDVDVIEVAVPLREAFWIANFNLGYADVIEPLYGLPYFSVYIVFYLSPPFRVHPPKPLRRL